MLQNGFFPFLSFFNGRCLKAVPIRRNNVQNIVFFLVSSNLSPVHRHFIQGKLIVCQTEAECDAGCMSPRRLFDPSGAFHFCRIFGMIDKAVLRQYGVHRCFPKNMKVRLLHSPVPESVLLDHFAVNDPLIKSSNRLIGQAAVDIIFIPVRRTVKSVCMNGDK